MAGKQKKSESIGQECNMDSIWKLSTGETPSTAIRSKVRDPKEENDDNHDSTTSNPIMNTPPSQQGRPSLQQTERNKYILSANTKIS